MDDEVSDKICFNRAVFSHVNYGKGKALACPLS